MDGHPPRGVPRAARAAAATAALGALLAVVAIAARGEHPGGSARLHQREVPAAVSNDLLTLLLLACLAAVVVLVVAAFALRNELWQTPPRRLWWRQLLLLWLVLGLLTFGGYRTIVSAFGNRGHDHVRGRDGGGGGAGRVVPQPAGTNRPADFDWVLAAVIAGGVVVVAAVVLVRRRRVEPAVEDPTMVEEELAAVVTDAIDDLRAEIDPRRAVIAAYARMERVLAQHGHARRASEAPYEYLPRILRALRVAPAAAERLTALFERAKFSPHEVDRTMKEQAIDALVAVRDDLRAVAAAA